MIEVDANDNFLREMKEAAGSDGVHPTTISRAIPLQGDQGQFNKSRFFMIFTGAHDNDHGGKPNPAQQEVLNSWGAKSYGGDREAWEISLKVATDIAFKVEKRPSAEPYEAFAHPAPD